MTAPADAAGMAALIARVQLLDEPTIGAAIAKLGDKKAPADDLLKLLERRGTLTPLQTEKLRKGETDGYLMGGYRLRYRIAAGSFGRVYRGDDPRTGHTVAVKVLRKRWADDPKRVAMFGREGRLGLSFRHPNIVQILALGRDTPTESYYLVMEFVEGGNLRDLLAVRRSVGLPEALRLMADCAAGLAYAHERGVGHRDIKATNILVATDGTAKLVDFGLAEAAEATDAPPARKGKGAPAADRTVDYAGLEKLTKVKSGDPRSDIYFLGHVLYEMIAGTPLLPRAADARAAADPARFEAADGMLPLRLANLGVPGEVQEVCERSLRLDPARRYQTAAEFLAGVRAAVAAVGPAEPPAVAGPAADGAGSDQGFSGVFASVLAETVAAAAPGPPARPAGPLTVFAVESSGKLRDVFADQLARLGFRVLVSGDPAVARARYQVEPYHALLVDAGAGGEAEVRAFRAVLADAAARNLRFAGVLLLSDRQAAVAQGLAGVANVAPLIRPVTMGQLAERLRALVPELAGPGGPRIGPPSDVLPPGPGQKG